MSKKKLLIHEVFDKAKEDFPRRNTKSGLSSELSDYFEKTWNFIIHERTFVRYYNACVRDNGEPDIIDGEILDKLSQYIGYRDFTHFSQTFTKKVDEEKATTVKIGVEGDELLGKNISIIITQYFHLPEFVKKNGLGIAGILLIGSVLIGNYRLPEDKGKKGSFTLGFFGGAVVNGSCMYWDKSEYRVTDCEDKNPLRSLIPKDTVQMKYFKRITRKDTLTIQNAMGRTWYSKFNGSVEFFTMDGVDPGTGRELRSSTPYIIEKYAGAQVQVDIPVEE